MKRSRVGPKSKAKQAAQTEQLKGADAQQIMAVLDGGSLPDVGTLLSLLNSAAPCEGLYSKACKGKGGNPNCLCNLIPGPEQHRRAGLWAKQPGGLAELGPDPATLKRQKPEQPCGLRNLGNTCYVNSVLQCLFANVAFRHAVYAARPPVADHPAVKELKHLFVELECGCVSPVDPGPLAAALALDHGVQQDGQEFMKLLLTMLEAQFGRQTDIKEAIPRLFRGQSGYETVCQQCHRPSESSSRSVTFYELDIPVKGFKSLEESLGSLLAPEFLCGDNQYSCDFCAAKVDATRQLRLRDLPPVLCMSLQRFVFDYNKMDRVKASDKFCFPLELDMGPHLGGDAAPHQPLRYGLVAILIHKGGSAMHGHYVAHINMEGEGPEGGWWRFDDEGVARMKTGPCGSADHGAVTAKRPAEEGGGGRGAKRGSGRGGGSRGGRGGRGRGRAGSKPPRGRSGRGRSRSWAAAADSDADSGSEEEDEVQEVLPANGSAAVDLTEDGEDTAMEVEGSVSEAAAAGGSSNAGGKAAAAPSEIVSQNAYLLVYRQLGVELPAVSLDEATQQWLAQSKGRLAAEYEQRCNSYASAKEGTAVRATKRQEEVRAVVEAATPVPEGDPGCYISSAWLQGWADADGSAPIDPVDNSDLLCTHGKLDPAKTQAMKRISSHAWEQLCSTHKGGPRLQPSDVCPTCLTDKLAAVVASEDNQEQRDHFLALAASLEEQEGEEGGGDFFVSKHWLSQWQKRSGRSMSATSPTAAITCPHGRLAPEQLGKQAKRVCIPKPLWQYLQRCWNAEVAERRRKQQQQQQSKAAGASPQEEVVVLDSDGDVAAPAAAASNSRAAASSEAVANGKAAANGKADSGSSEVEEVLKAEEGGSAEAAGAAAAAAGSDEAEAPALRSFEWDCEECPVCQVELNEAARIAQGLRGRREAEKAALADLMRSPPVTQPVPGVAYNLVPSSFMERWRSYMAQAGRRGAAATPGAVAQPPSLIECMAGVMCECHSGAQPRLAYPPPAVVNKRGRWVVAEHEEQSEGGAVPAAAAAAAAAGAAGGDGVAGLLQGESVWQLVSPADWRALVAVYGEGDTERLERGVTATLQIASSAPSNAGAAAAAPAAAGGAAAAPSADVAAAAPSSATTAAATTATASESAPATTAAATSSVSADVYDDSAARDPDYSESDIILEGYQRPRKQPNRGGGMRAWLEPSPPVCEATVAARREAAKAALLVYEGAEVMVEVTTLEEAAAKPAAQAGGERKSKRARKGRAPLTLSSNLTLGALRLRIFEAVGVHPLNARLFVRGEALEREDSATLAECEIYPGEEIKVVDSGEHDASDYASIVALYGGDTTAGGRLGRQREAERGFTGTALAGLHTGFEEAGGQQQGQREEGGGQAGAAEPMAQD